MSDPLLAPGTNHCLCAACGEYFTNERNFDLHRRCQEAGSSAARTRACVPPGSITNRRGKARLRRNARGLWASAEGAYIPT